MMLDETAPRIAAAAYWSPHLVFIVTQGDVLIQVERTRLRARDLAREEMGDRLYRLYAKHLPDEFVIEANVARAVGVNASSNLIRVMTLAEAKAVLLPPARPRTHVALCMELLRTFPDLHQHLKVTPTPRLQATWRSWQTVTILAAALALASRRSPNLRQPPLSLTLPAATYEYDSTSAPAL